jgi:S-adenosylmethionine:tRNA ribosyltransferase-isomerase
MIIRSLSPLKASEIHIRDYDYLLPEDRIAKFPLAKRDTSKLLIYEKGHISHTIFRKIVKYIPATDLLVFNNTRVIQSRFIFKKPTGAFIEIFCLEPSEPADYKQSLQNTHQVTWQCLIGNAKRWKSGVLIKSALHQNKKITILAEKLEKTDNAWSVRFTWEPETYTFADILTTAGLIPIPPYLKREPVPEDQITYQTVYSSVDGSVAAPTAGFHFTHEIIEELKNKGVSQLELTLHVGAGTFRPVLATEIHEHTMHSEHIFFRKDDLKKLSAHEGKITAVGTTSARTLETIYWLGCKIKQKGNMDPQFLYLDQWEDRNLIPLSKDVILETLLEYSEKNKINDFHGITRLMIIPGYRYHMVDRIITNFHQPKSTLLLLISGFIGEDWKKVYEYAMNHDFRFLSYGDSSLLISQK